MTPDLLQHRLRGLPLAVIDFETTGPDPSTCQPVQVAVAHCDLAETEAELVYQSLVCPVIPIPAEATAVHGITDEMVREAPLPAEVARALEPMLYGRVVVAYNAPFDWAVLNGARAKAGMSAMAPEWLDPYVWVQLVDRYKRGKRLTDAAARRGLAVEGAHDAGSDVRMTAGLVPLLLGELWDESFVDQEHLDELGRFLPWQLERALVEEVDRIAYFDRVGRGRPSTPYHELLDLPLPLWAKAWREGRIGPTVAP